MDFDVVRRVTGGVECRQRVNQRKRRGNDGCGVDDAAGDEPDHSWPETDRTDQPTDPERLGLDQAELRRCLGADVDPDIDDTGAQACDMDAHAAFCRTLLDRGVYPPPSQYEAWFPSLAHDAGHVERTADAARLAFAAL